MSLPRKPLSRRRVLVLSAGAMVAPALLRSSGAAVAAGEIETHGLSGFGDLKYPADFKHFDYVNPDAPKGGIFSHIGGVRLYNQNFLTFNSLNSFILKGDGAMGMELTFATLMTDAEDEPDAMYGLAARAVRISASGLVYRFLMRPQARFHDGTKLTAHDAAFSINVLKKDGHPNIYIMLRDVIGAEAESDEILTVRFAENRARDLPLFVAGQVPIFSRAYYEHRKFDESTLDIPLGSGPYRVGRFEPGRYIEYDRVPDWWGASLPVSVGRYNFGTARYEFYRDRDVGFEGFTAKSYLFREEFTSRTWATRYDFPAIRDGRVKQELIPDDTPSAAQGWSFNTRRPKFANPRFREALNYAFDFEWTNKTIMYGAYKRTHSLFQNSDMMAVGPPGPEELKLLEPWRGKVPDQVFGEPFVPPVSDGSGQDRALLRKASQMLQEAGFPIKNGKRVNAAGEPITFEFLFDDPQLQAHHNPFIKNLATLGIDATLRIVDPVQYRARVEDFDFDVTMERLSLSNTPGDALRTNFTSQAAATKGSYNFSGISNPAVDALVDKVIEAKTRVEMVTACRALDRVVRAGFYWIPQWYNPAHRLAYWNVFAHPKTNPRYPRGLPPIWATTWWYDRDKAAKLEKSG
jgi:microcin C transport system substrate-binding protein